MSTAQSPPGGTASERGGLHARIVATPLFRNRPRNLQFVLGGVLPVIFGVIAGVLIGASGAAYWIWGLLAALGAFLSGFEHRDGWGGADRGFFGGVLYGVALLVTHAIVGTHAQVSLGGFPPFLAAITALVGMLLAAASGRIARIERAKDGIVFADRRDQR